MDKVCIIAATELPATTVEMYNDWYGEDGWYLQVDAEYMEQVQRDIWESVGASSEEEYDAVMQAHLDEHGLEWL